MDQELCNKLIQEIGASIVSDERYLTEDWDSAAIVVSLGMGRKNLTGYVYQGATFSARIPANAELVDSCLKLQEALRTPTGELWHQMLIHLTKPGPEINVKFEYSNPKRWSLQKAGLDLSNYAETLRPRVAPETMN